VKTAITDSIDPDPIPIVESDTKFARQTLKKQLNQSGCQIQISPIFNH
jgi:hypothetical protein